MTNGVPGAGKGSPTVQKGTGRLLTMKLKIVSSKENPGWGGGSWRLLKIVSDSA